MLICRPMACDIATCVSQTGLDPFTKQGWTSARGLRDSRMQRALMQCFEPENYFQVREALIQASRQDLDRRQLRLPHPRPTAEGSHRAA
jgi:hypothetical protein